MTLQTSVHHPSLSSADINETYLRACRFIAPLFDLRDMVAVNPFMGFLDQPFSEAALTIESLFHEPVVPSTTQTSSPAGPRVLCVADQLQTTSPQLADAPFKAITRFLAARYDSQGPSPFQGSSLYRAYLDYASTDRAVDANGLVGFRILMSKLPNEEGKAREFLVSQLGTDTEALAHYFGRLLARVKGFAGYLQAQAYDAGADSQGELPELLTILLAQDFALAQLSRKSFAPVRTEASVEYMAGYRSSLERLEYEETSLTQQLEAKFKAPAPRSERALAQAVFCIDVRSERYRRLLEQESSIETYGFAGFFGLPMGVTGAKGHRPHCPPLLNPAFTVPEETQGTTTASHLKSGFQRSLSAPLSSLGHVEAWGMTYALKLLKETFPQAAKLAAPQRVEPSLKHLKLENRVRMAQGILKNLGLNSPLAPFVVLVGHDSQVTNNLQEASLACGACAGHSGGPNAQVAACLLNDPSVREQLNRTGHNLPDDVVFLAAVHETVSDTVQFLDADALPPSQKTAFAQLERCFVSASNAARQEKVAVLGDHESHPRTGFIRRAHDYAETQAEWGLAGNAAFIVGQRELSERIDLQGRAFLHSYDEAQDDDSSILEMILTAPAVVGSWINLQYYASTVAPRSFGCGRKTLHNHWGSSGVIEGGQGDLAVGLSRESLTQGTQDGSAHAPLRLHLVVQAQADRVCDILSRHTTLRDLVAGQWIRVSTLRIEAGQVKLESLAPHAVLESAAGALAAE